jgi:hypothetical protein
MQGSKKRHTQVNAEEQISNSILMYDDSRPLKANQQVSVRKGISKSTLRQNLKSINNTLSKNMG